MKLKFSLFLLIAVLSLQANAQAKWTLEDCINYAHANNLQVKRQELQADIANNNYTQSFFNLAPNLSGNINRSYNTGHKIDPLTNSFNESTNDSYGLSSSMNVFNGLQTINNIKRNQYLMLASIQNVEKEKVMLTLDIASAYLNILFKKELLDVNISQMEVTKLQVDRTIKLVNAGSAAKGDLLEFQAQLATEYLNVTNAKNELNLAYLNLTQLLDLDSVGGFEIVLPDTVAPDMITPFTSADQVYHDAITFIPHIKAAEYQLKSYEKDLAIQRGRRSPQIYLSGGWGSGYSTSDKNAALETYSYKDQLFDRNRSTTLSAGISIPIFNNWDVNTSISNAKVRVDDAEYQLKQTKQQLYKQIQQAYNDALSAGDKYNAAIEAVNSYSESFKYTEHKFNVGIMNFVEYSLAKYFFIKAQSELLQAKYEYLFQIKILDFYRGVPITL
jgi:outer membrane protein